MLDVFLNHFAPYFFLDLFYFMYMLALLQAYMCSMCVCLHGCQTLDPLKLEFMAGCEPQ